MIPCTWCSGRKSGMTSSDCQAQASISVVIWAAMLPWVVTAPLGLLVVPLVNTIMALRSGVRFGSRAEPSTSNSPTSPSGIASRSQSP